METLYGEALSQATQRSCCCHIPGCVQGKVGWGFGQTGPVRGVPASGRGTEACDL